ncbi:MAG: heparinase [Xanthobacteraceae bacterium]|nr:MAG: heparinase [Xanthobacteraceae bacterium]
MARGSLFSQTRISTLVLDRVARRTLARLSWTATGLRCLMPGRTDRLLIAPQELRTADATRAAEIYAGRFVFAGKIVSCHGRSPFDVPAPSEDWEIALHGFAWLRHLRAADSAITRANARSLVDEWIARQRRVSTLAWRADVVARRIISLLSQAPLLLNGTDGRFYRRFLRSLSREVRYLRSMLVDAPDGLPRLQALIALCYGSLCLANQGGYINAVARRLSEELGQQILADGGHVSRNPAVLIELLLDLLPLRQTFAARNVAPPPALLNAIDRMMPMLRFFRHGDGQLALFNGMGATPNDLLATILIYDDSRGAPMAGMPHSGYQRMAAGSLVVLMDTGVPPPPGVSHEAHAGCLSFELSSGTSRIVVNCGLPATGRDNWRAFARGTAAHSTLVFHDTPSCQFVELSAVKRFLQGAPIVSGPREVEVFREALPEGTLLTAIHDAYSRSFNVLHRRALMLAGDGHRLDGEDTLVHGGGAVVHSSVDDYAVRFHLHPGVKASRLGDARGVMLVLPNREVWIFESPEATVTLEDSVFLAGSDGPRRTVQIVIRGQANEAASVRWSFMRSPTSPAATTARHQARREPELPL